MERPLLKAKSLRSSTFVLVRIFHISSLLKSKVFGLHACLDDSSAPSPVSAFSLFLELKKSKLELFWHRSPSDRNDAKTIPLEGFSNLLTNLECSVYCGIKTHPYEPIDLKIEKGCEDTLSIRLIVMAWSYTMLAKNVYFV